MSEISPQEASLLYFRALTKSDTEARELFAEGYATWNRYGTYLNNALNAEQAKYEHRGFSWKYDTTTFRIKLQAKETLIIIPSSSPLIKALAHPAKIPKPRRAFRRTTEGTEDTVQILSIVQGVDGVKLTTSPELHDGDILTSWGDEENLLVSGQDDPRLGDILLDTQGVKLTIIEVIHLSGEVRIVLDGLAAPGDLILNGRTLTHERIDPKFHLIPIGEKLYDDHDNEFTLSRVEVITSDTNPVGELLRTSNEIFTFGFEVEVDEGSDHENWIQVCLDKNDEENAIDPREGLFAELDKELRVGKKTVKILKKDEYGKRLLIRGSLPRDYRIKPTPRTADYLKQLRALHNLAYRPLPEQASLHRLGLKQKQSWPTMPELSVPDWKVLVNDYDPRTKKGILGTGRQREFVQRALATPDFTILEGPPGSGKTTAIVELILQLLEREPSTRILVCGNTYAAIDNVIEKLSEKDKSVDIVKVGQRGGYHDERRLHIRAKLLAKNMNIPVEEAERLLATAATVTCGTVMGISNHPWFSKSRHPEDPMTRNAPWDYFIVDESSKTPVQEFLMPALLARRWIIVGDVQQLAPFVDEGGFTTNLNVLLNSAEQEAVTFSKNFEELWPELYQLGQGYCFVHRCSDAAIPIIIKELKARITTITPPCVGTVMPRNQSITERGCLNLVVDSLTTPTSAGKARGELAMQQLILIDHKSFAVAREFLPDNIIYLEPLSEQTEKLGHLLQGRQRRISMNTSEEFCKIIKKQANEEHKGFTRELSWRMSRIHQLRKGPTCERYRKDIAKLMPAHRKTDALGELYLLGEIALPSILEALQIGIPKDSNKTTYTPTSLSEGLIDDTKKERLTKLDYQHRMHEDISNLPRDLFYNKEALKDSNSLNSDRRKNNGWNYQANAGGNRRCWHHVGASALAKSPYDRQDQMEEEIKALRKAIASFATWAKVHPPSGERKGKQWEIACLSFYTGQESKIFSLLKDELGQYDDNGWFSGEHFKVKAATVDKFQGHEADLVFLLMRQNTKDGFLDVKNRINVAITRAREQLVIIGDCHYFMAKTLHRRKTRTDHLIQLATHSPI